MKNTLICVVPSRSTYGFLAAIAIKHRWRYWRGNINKMLQRIYGTAFHDKALKAHLTRLEEAAKVITASVSS